MSHNPVIRLMEGSDGASFGVGLTRSGEAAILYSRNPGEETLPSLQTLRQTGDSGAVTNASYLMQVPVGMKIDPYYAPKVTGTVTDLNTASRCMFAKYCIGNADGWVRPLDCVVSAWYCDGPTAFVDRVELWCFCVREFSSALRLADMAMRVSAGDINVGA